MPYNLNDCGGYRYIPSRLPDFLENASPCCQRLWFYLIRKVKINDTASLKRGQLIATYQGLSDGIYWTENRQKKSYSAKEIRTCIAMLKKHGIVDTKQITGGSAGFVLTMCFYREIQTWESYKNEPGQGVEIKMHNDTDSLYDYKNEPGQGVGQGPGQAMSILNNTPVSIEYNNTNTREDIHARGGSDVKAYGFDGVDTSICHNCGAWIGEDADICPNCGASC